MGIDAVATFGFGILVAEENMIDGWYPWGEEYDSDFDEWVLDKYGDSFVELNLPLLERTPMHRVGRVLGRIDRELTRRFKDTEIGRGWRQGYFVGKEKD